MAIFYTHRQFSRATVVSFIAMAAVLLAVLMPSTMRQALAEHPIIVVAVTAAVILAVAAHFVVNVSDHELSWYFGPGFWKKRVLRSDITGIQRIRLPWWYGIGIKRTPGAWVYLVAPSDGVEIALGRGKAVTLALMMPMG